MATETAEGVPEPLKYKTWKLKVPIHCGGCAKKVKRVLQTIDGVFTISIDPQLHKVVVTGDVGSETLIKRLVRSGKQAELWTEKSEKKSSKSKKIDGDNNKVSKDGHEQDAGNDKAEKTEKPDENKGTDESKDRDEEGENSSSETEEKATEANPASPADGGGKIKKKKKKKKKKGQQNANAEGSKDAPAGSQPHFNSPDSVSPAYAPLNSCPPDRIMEAFPHYVPLMYGVSHSAANPSIGASYYAAASPMNYSFLYSLQVRPYPPSDLIKTYHDGDDDPYYDDDDEGGCSIM